MLSLAGPARAVETALLVAGDRDELRETIADVSLALAAVRQAGTTRQGLVAAANADYQRFLAALYDEGFFGPTVSITIDGREAAAYPPLVPPGQPQQLVIRVEPGPIYRFGAAQIGPLPYGVVPAEPFRPGLPASTDALREAADEGIEAWRLRGHAKAELAGQDLVADHAANALNARLRLAPGPRLRFGPLIVQGNVRVRTERIREIAGLPTGETFTPEEVEFAAHRLQRTGAFRSVALTEAEAIAPGGVLPITAAVVEALPRSYGFGAELSSLEGLTLSAYWLHRNLFGGAERLRVEGEVANIAGETGGTDYRIYAAFNRPATFNSQTDLYIIGEIEQLNEPDYSSKEARLEVGATRIVSEEFRYSYGVSFDRSIFTDDFGRRGFTLLGLPLNAELDRRDDDLDPRRGIYLEASLRPFVGVSDSPAGLRATVDARGYRSFGREDRTTVALRLQAGLLAGPDLLEAPPDYLFYSGGGGTVRGQEYQSLGIVQPTGQRTGGKSFVGFSSELRFRTEGNLGFVGFFDAGYVAPGSGFSDGEWHTGAGLGARYDTGIGPIRLDVAFPVSGPGDSSGAEIYIGIGQAF